jgi:hypothetical protein
MERRPTCFFIGLVAEAINQKRKLDLNNIAA